MRRRWQGSIYIILEESEEETDVVTFLAGQHPSTMFISHRALPLVVVVLVVLAGAPLFASWEAPAQPLQVSHSIAFGPASGSGESSIPSSASMLSAPENYKFD